MSRRALRVNDDYRILTWSGQSSKTAEPEDADTSTKNSRASSRGWRETIAVVVRDGKIVGQGAARAALRPDTIVPLANQFAAKQ
jgi:hypothetical protein